MAELVNLKECIVSGKLEDAKTIVNEAIAAGTGHYQQLFDKRNGGDRPTF